MGALRKGSFTLSKAVGEKWIDVWRCRAFSGFLMNSVPLEALKERIL